MGIEDQEEQSLPVPYLSVLDGLFTPGHLVTIKGVLNGPDPFSVSLMAGAHYEQDDCPLHMSYRQKDKEMVLNSFADGHWDKKESRKKCIFKDENTPFEIRIRAHDDRYEIFVNQREFAEFEHRLPLSSITHLYICGDIELHHVNWGGKYYPVPYQAGISGGLVPGKTLLISGMPEKKPKRFTINLLAKTGDIIFQFDARFDDKVVVRNAKLNDQWEAEEREGKFPFEKEHGFDILMNNEPYAFQVYVNGTHFCSFAHRADPHAVAGLHIEGDIEIHAIVAK